MTDYGSGLLGDYQGLQHLVSTNWATAPVGFIGDSIGVRGRPKLGSMLTAEFGAALAYDCWSGAPFVALVNDLLTRDLWPGRLLVGLGTNDVCDPPKVAAQLQRIIDAAPPTTTIVAIDTYVARTSLPAATQLNDVRNSGWVNTQIHAALPREHVVGWNAALGYAVGRGPEMIKYYLQDGVHPWVSAGSTPYAHGNGVDFWAEVVMKVLRPLLAA